MNTLRLIRIIRNTTQITLIASALALASVSHGATSTWNQAGGGVFNDGSNWTGGLPGTSDTALFNLSEATPIEITFNNEITTAYSVVKTGSYIFDLSNGNGGYTYTLTGTSTTLNGNWNDIGTGSGNNATVEIINGTISSTRSVIGRKSGTGHVTVGSGGVWNLSHTNSVMVGWDDGGTGTHGSLTLRDGGKVTAPRVMFGTGGGTASVLFTGSESTYTTNGLVAVGNGGDATFIIAAGASLVNNNLSTGSNHASITRGADASSTALVTGTGSSWTLNGTNPLRVGGDQTEAKGAGTLMVSDGGVVNSQGGFHIWSTGTVGGNSSITGNVNNLGAVTPGVYAFDHTHTEGSIGSEVFSISNAIGTLTITGNYTQVGKLVIRIADAIDGSDRLHVVGNVDLDGILEINPFDSPTLSQGDTFEILTHTGTLDGTFSSITAFDPGSGLAWDFDNLYIDGTISVIPEPGLVALLMAGVAGLVVIRFRRRRA